MYLACLETGMLEDMKERVTATIRDCEPSDYAAIAEIYTEYILKGGSTMDTEPKNEAYIRNLVANFNDREKILVMEQAGYVIAWGIIKRYSDRLGYRVCCETSVYVRGSELRKGHGSSMKKRLIEECRALGYHHLVAKIFSINVASIEYNKRLGYELVGVQRQIGYRDGKWIDMTIMQLILDDVPPYQPNLC